MKPNEALDFFAYNLPIGQHKKKCPVCSSSRKKHRNDPCLSLNVDHDRVIFKCHHCDWSGIHPNNRSHISMQADQVNAQRFRKLEKKPLSKQAVDWLHSRGISKDTAVEAELFCTDHYISSEGKEVPCIGFPYKHNHLDQGAKIRSLSSKGFSCTNALRHFFNSDSVGEDDEIVIVEGEMDAMAFMQAGVSTVWSVPNGAVVKTNKNSPRGEFNEHLDKSFAFLWNARDQLSNAKKIIIAADSDEAGVAMAEEIARRIGKDRCHKIVWPDDCKDANDALLKRGENFLVECVEKAQPWPVAGVYQVESFREQVMQMYHEGVVGGLSTGFGNVDRLYTVMEGQLTVVTGTPSHGKSEFVDQLMFNLAQNYGTRFAICSFENDPKTHLSKLVSKFSGKPFFEGSTPRLGQDELNEALDFLQEHFIFLHHRESNMATLDDILERLRIAVLRHGIRGAVIDPYNYIQQPKDSNETHWISSMLTKIRVFAQSFGIHVWFVAHPTKGYAREGGSNPVPKGNDISGSAAWFAKADFGLTVYRPDPEQSLCEIHCWKVRYSWCGSQGHTALMFDKLTSRYRELGYQDRYQESEDSEDSKDLDDGECPF